LRARSIKMHFGPARNLHCVGFASGFQIKKFILFDTVVLISLYKYLGAKVEAIIWWKCGAYRSIARQIKIHGGPFQLIGKMLQVTTLTGLLVTAPECSE